MKSLLLIVATFISTMSINAQSGSWTVKLNDKTLISTSVEDEKINCKKLKHSDLKKNGNLEIIFNENEPDTWVRIFLLNDEGDNELKKIDSTNHMVISVEELKKIYKGKKKIIIYTVVFPSDPTINIRIRRVLLYTFILP